MSANRSEKAALVGVVLLLLAVATVIITPPADGYEISLYDAYPIYLWVFVIGAMFAGALAVIKSAERSDDRTWTYGLLVILMTDVLLLLMPVFRGYAAYGRADTLTHVGYITNIMNTNGIAGNLYPPLHLLALAVADAAGIELMTVTLLVPLVFSMIFFGGMFYLLAYLFDSRETVLFGLPIAMLPILNVAHVSFRPFDASLMLLPLVFYVWIKGLSNLRVPDRSALVVVLTALILYHPITGLFFTIVAVVYFAGTHLPYQSGQFRYTNVTSLSAALFVSWYTTFNGVIIRFESIYQTVFGVSEGTAPVESYQQTIAESSPKLVDLARVAVFRHGLEFVLFSLGGLFVLFLASKAFRKKYALDARILALSGGFVLFSFGGLAFLLSDLIIPPTRPWQFAKICAAVLTAGLMYYLYSSYGHSGRDRAGSGRSVANLSITVVVLIVIVLSVLSFYPSPLQSKTNFQVTEMEIDGTRWLTEHGEASDRVVEFGIEHRRFYEAGAGTTEEKPFSTTDPPDHFNYTENRILGASYEDRVYLTLTRKGRVLYPETYEDYREEWRYTPSDFARLESDRTVSRVYDNGDYNQYLVEGTRTTNATA